jgi:hypothetical protein
MGVDSLDVAPFALIHLAGSTVFSQPAAKLGLLLGAE